MELYRDSLRNYFNNIIISRINSTIIITNINKEYKNIELKERIKDNIYDRWN